jgi:hypothetical protein
VAAGAVYTVGLPVQKLVGPEIPPFKTGGDATDTKALLEAEVPHALAAVTLIVPDAPAVTVIVLLLPPMLHPAGSDHVYEDALLTGVML